MSSQAATLTRVTIISPRSRIDLALPSDVPMADMLPTVLQQAGEYYMDEALENGGWIVSRLGDEPIDMGQSCSQLSVQDGDILYLNPANSAKPEVVFDDVIDAIATATEGRTDRWTHKATQRFATALGTIALVTGAVAVLLAGPPHFPGAVTALGAGLVLIAVAAILSRAVGDSRAAVYFGVTGVVYGAVGGLLILAEDSKLTELGEPHLFMTASAVVLYSFLGMVGIGTMRAAPVFVTTIFSALILAIGVGVKTLFADGDAGLAASISATIALTMLPFAPKIGLSMAKVPVPTLPNTTEELKSAGDENIDGKKILMLSEHAGNFLSALYSFIALVAFVSALTLAFDGSTPGLLLAVVISLIVLSRARTVDTYAARLTVLSAGLGGLGATLAAIFIQGNLVIKLVAVLGGLVLLTVITMGYGLAVAGKKLPPTYGRMLDIAEALLIVSLLPLTGWMAGWFMWGLGIKG
ncbi:type VII secretion integral membrane protein EccD [Salininema proteolyticum]|uniref:Type VII secretion integral membrane protein EccD n=1 Tax=Salininema proteolyticum TaxID=1607685 RepID=A0ABV8U3N5_9ACTN